MEEGLTRTYQASSFFSLVDHKCSLALDVAFILDRSRSVGLKNWKRMKLFLISLVMKLHVSEDNTHVSAITFSKTAKVVFKFDNNQTTYEVSTTLYGMQYKNTGGTYIDRALKKANNNLFTAASGMRSNATKVSKYKIII